MYIKSHGRTCTTQFRTGITQKKISVQARITMMTKHNHTSPIDSDIQIKSTPSKISMMKSRIALSGIVLSLELIKNIISSVQPKSNTVCSTLPLYRIEAVRKIFTYRRINQRIKEPLLGSCGRRNLLFISNKLSLLSGHSRRRRCRTR